MTVSEAAEMWKISKSTVYKYCKNNFVECEKKNNVWVISDNHPKPLNIRKQKITQIKIEYFILKALKVDNTEFDIPNNYILTPLGERIIIEKKEKTLKILNEILKTAFVALDVATKIGA